MSAPLATPAHIAVEWRELTAAEETKAWRLLARASAMVRDRVPTVDARMADGTLDVTLVEGVVVDMVLRAMRNPDGFVQRTVGEVSVSFGRDVPAGRLTITAEELALLGGASSQFGSISLCRGL